MSKFIFVIGGVLSGIGKGVSAASLGRLLKSRGYSIFVQKLDPYLNVDPGTMSPYEHGEVFITKDGGETDLDLGHYERFIGTQFTKNSNFTSGKIYSQIFENERKGKYEGKTVQIIPHVTDHIEKLILDAAKESKADFIITEVGGTVGDIESQPFIFALAKFATQRQKDSFFIHTTFVPYLEASKEFKSKPTQHSLRDLRQYGINPNMVILRANKSPTEEIIDKTASASLLAKEAVIGLPNVDNIYKVPLVLEEKKAAHQVLKYFEMKNKTPKLDDWNAFVSKIDLNPSKEITIGMVGKYVKFQDAYLSIIEALKISAIYEEVKINFKWIQCDSLTEKNIDSKLGNLDGVLLLPGFGKRGFDGKVIAAQYLRNTKIPTLGICYGLQAMTVAQAISVGYSDAISKENEEQGNPIIDLLNCNKKGNNKDGDIGGTLYLGEKETIVKQDTLAHSIYKNESIFERHRHRYEVNLEYKDALEKNGFVFSGISKENGIIDIVEYNKHPFYIGVQFHPEFNSNPLTDHPLFKTFIQKVNNKSK